MTKSLTRLVSTVTLISALGLGAAFAQGTAPVTSNAATTPALTAPATGKVVDSKAKTVEHKATKDQASTKTHALKPDAAKTDKKAAIEAPQTSAKAGSTSPVAAPKS